MGRTLIDIFPFLDEAVIIYNSLLPIRKKTKMPILNIRIEGKTFKFISEYDVLHHIESLTKVHIEESNPFASRIIEKTMNPVVNSPYSKSYCACVNSTCLT